LFFNIADLLLAQAKLGKLLKICVRADYMYHGDGPDASLRRCGCTPGTRVSILEAIIRWILDMSPSGERVYWLSGQAGAGKTTIAFEIACRLENLVIDGQSRVVLGATFFCSRQFLDTRSASSIIRTIVYHLALRSKAFRESLEKHGRFETVDHGPRSQLMGLLVEPWKMSASERKANKEPCFMVGIDALDELEGTGGVEFLSTLFEVVNKQDLSGLRFLVTSRSEPSLVKQIESFANKQVCRLEHVRIQESSADIKVYLSAKLAECASPGQIDQLVVEADGLFIHASTVVEFVKQRDVDEQRSLLGRLLDSSSSARRPLHRATASLDRLYLQILETSLVDPREASDFEAFKDALDILHTFICTIQRTSISVAVALLNASRAEDKLSLDDGIAKGVLHRLYAVLRSYDGQVMWFHKSFPDFLFDENRSGRFHCKQEQHHLRLTDGCLKIMMDELRFNIANVPSSHYLDCKNPTLSASIDANISKPLRYASSSWSDHLILTHREARNRLAETLERLLLLPILFWMEVMNLLRQHGNCQRMLRDAQRWFQPSKVRLSHATLIVDLAQYSSRNLKDCPASWRTQLRLLHITAPARPLSLHPISIYHLLPPSCAALPSWTPGGETSPEFLASSVHKCQVKLRLRPLQSGEVCTHSHSPRMVPTSQLDYQTGCTSGICSLERRSGS
jgi:NACHT domain